MIDNKRSEIDCIYDPLDFYMLRVPLLSMDFYRDLFLHNNSNDGDILNISKDKILNFTKDPLVREIISVSSLSLLESMDKLENKENERKKNQVIDGLLKYLIRMSTRSTPFGLMAGVTVGSYGTNTNLSLKPLSTYKKWTRPDMEWILGIINKLEERYDIIFQLKVMANPTIVFLGDRVELPYNTKYGQQEENKFGMDNVSIRATEAVKFTLKQAEGLIPYKELLSRIESRYPDTDRKKIEGFLLQLFKNEILISELRPPFTVESPFKYVIDKLCALQGIDYELQLLKDIYNQILEYDNKPLGEGEKDLLTLVHKMRSMNSVKNPLQVDLAVNSDQAILNKEIAEELAKTAECLWRLSSKDKRLHNLTSYRLEFIEKYGTYREIPVLELLDEDHGLGAPPFYEYPRSKRQHNYTTSSNSSNKLKHYLSREFAKTLRNNSKEIEITDEFLSTLDNDKFKPEDAPNSLELYANIIAPSYEAIDKGDYELVVGANAFSPGAGKTFGRFADMLGKDLKNKLKEINDKELLLVKDAVFAEITYLPAQGRYANVAIAPNIREYEIALATNSSKDMAKTLPLSDILIGATADSFYIKSRSLGKRLIITTGHMLNTSSAPNVYRFLREISQENILAFQSFSWGELVSSPYLPRVRYRKTILSPATWKLSFDILGELKGISEEQFFHSIKLWKDQWQVPTLVYLTVKDHKILLDLSHPLHLRELLLELNKAEDLTLVENICGYNKHFVQGESGDYISEIVVPLIRKDYESTSNKIHSKRPSISTAYPSHLNECCRMKLPGSEWLFLKLYGNSKRENELIAFYLRDFCNEAISNNLADEFFFMRYTDKAHHLRVRFKGEPEKLTNILLPKIYQWSSNLHQCGLLSTMAIDTYEREVERYGGKELIDFAEKVFFYDSKAVSHLIFLERTNQLKINFDILCVISIIHILEDFQLDFKSQLQWLDSIVDISKYKEEFRKDRSIFVKLANSNNNWNNLRNHEGGEEIYNILSSRKNSIHDMCEIIKEAEISGNLCNDKENILSSLIHLHCNRMLGTDRDKEKKIMTLTRHALYNLRYIKENELGK